MLNTQSDGTQPELSNATKGHLVLLEPTNIPNDQSPALLVARCVDVFGEVDERLCSGEPALRLFSWELDMLEFTGS